MYKNLVPGLNFTRVLLNGSETLCEMGLLLPRGRRDGDSRGSRRWSAPWLFVEAARLKF